MDGLGSMENFIFSFLSWQTVRVSQLILLPIVGQRWCSLGDCIWQWLSILILPRKPKKLHVTLNCYSKNGWLDREGAKKVSFTSPKKFFDEHWLQFFCNLNSLKELCLPVRQVKNRDH